MGDKTKSTIVKTMIYVFLILVAVIYIAPLLWVLMVFQPPSLNLNVFVQKSARQIQVSK